MKRAAAKVAAEIADTIGASPHIDDAVLVGVPQLQSWLLALAPPQKRRAPTKSQIDRKEHRASVKELDDLFREVIRKRDGMRCRRCKKESRLQVHHIFSRRSHRLRWTPINGILICSGCHLWAHEAGKDPERVKFFEEQLGTRAYLELARMAKTAGKAPDHRLVKLHLEKELA